MGHQKGPSKKGSPVAKVASLEVTGPPEQLRVAQDYLTKYVSGMLRLELLGSLVSTLLRTGNILAYE